MSLTLLTSIGAHSTKLLSSNTLQGSMLFGGATNRFATSTYTGLSAIGTNNFCVEFWCKIANVTTQGQCFVGCSNYTSGMGWGIGYGLMGTSAMTFYSDTGLQTIETSGITFVANTWYHVAVTRSSGTLRIFINGTLRGSGTNTQNYNLANGTLCLGKMYGDAGDTGNSYMVTQNCQLTGIRISNIARYTNNFVPNTNLYTSDANTYVAFHCPTSSNYLSTQIGSVTMTNKGGISFSSNVPP